MSHFGTGVGQSDRRSSRVSEQIDRFESVQIEIGVLDPIPVRRLLGEDANLPRRRSAKLEPSIAM